MDRFEVRLSITKLLIVLIVVIVPLSVIGFVLTERSDKSLDNAIGNDYKALAQTYSSEVADYMSDRVADVNAMAADSSILAAVSGRETGKSTAGGSKATPNASASDFLRHRTILDPRLLNVVVTDSNANVVASAAQAPRTDYSQDEFWQAVYNKGQGAMKISDILYNEVQKAYYVNVGFPMNDAAGNFLGVLSAAVNISPLLSRFQQNEIGNGAQATLVDENGMIVSGPNTDVFARARSAQFDSVRDAMGSSTAGQHGGWTMASVNNVGYIVGYSSTGGKRRTEASNPANPGWVVLVSQREAAAVAPIRGLERFALLMVVLAIFMLTLLFVYWYLHHKQRFEDIEARPEEEGGTGRAAAASV